MTIKNIEFICSSPKLENCPKSSFPEYAFIGRSNVGKSSLINMLSQRKDIAKTSSTPGKTQLINHFFVDEKWYMVDLPGYGFAKTAKKNRSAFSQLISDYITKREELTNLFVLVDSRLEPQKIDVEFINWLGEHNIPFALIFTKIDKLSSVELNKNLSVYKKKLLTFWESLPPIFITSSESRFGKEPILEYIDKINKSLLIK